MHVRAGTSGFSYDEWKGVFYPDDISGGEMLAYYATRLPCVEINNTFYRMPKAEMVSAWGNRVPEAFRFAIKAPRRITHMQKLRGAEDSIEYLLKATSGLGEKLGSVLFQLPPFLKKDLPLLAEFLQKLPKSLRSAFEFRHVSWFADEVFDTLHAHDAALCTGDAEKSERSPPLVATASWGYLRLRADDYTDAALDAWAERIRSQPWSEVYAFLKHEVRGPELASALLGRLGAEPPSATPS
jgi:uncharacterized protein YecE (DUF72 family)